MLHKNYTYLNFQVNLVSIASDKRADKGVMKQKILASKKFLFIYHLFALLQDISKTY